MRPLVTLGLFAAAATVSAHPASLKASPGIRRRTVNLESFRLKATAQYVNSTLTDNEPSLKAIKRADSISTATELVKAKVPNAEFRLVDDHYVGTNGIAHVNFKQTVHGLDIDNADFNVNVCSQSQYKHCAYVLTQLDWSRRKRILVRRQFLHRRATGLEPLEEARLL